MTRNSAPLEGKLPVFMATPTPNGWHLWAVIPILNGASHVPIQVISEEMALAVNASRAAQPANADAWQDISTAPKDDEGCIFNGYSADTGLRYIIKVVDGTFKNFFALEDSDEEFHNLITHWAPALPLPKPPEATTRLRAELGEVV